MRIVKKNDAIYKFIYSSEKNVIEVYKYEKIGYDFEECYYLLENGNGKNIDQNTIIQLDKDHSLLLRLKDGHRKRVYLKSLYKKVYGKNYYKDEIQDIEGEEWLEIKDTDGLYLVSNKGKIKSLKWYNAIILKHFKNKSGYQRVDIIEEGYR